MHEVGIILGALDVATRTARAAGAARIERVTFSIVPGGHVTRDAVDTLFVALSRGSIAEGATLEFETRSADRYCPACARVYLGTEEGSACPRCGLEGFLPPDLADLFLTSITVAD
jgi:hydrogenase nickel incorporation protein HypA/HybF